MATTSWHLALDPLAAFGIILLFGTLGGQLACRIAHLPRVTGLILTGLVIGPNGLNLIPQSLFDEAGLFIQLALGLALFELGRRIDLGWMLRERALLRTGILLHLALLAVLAALLSVCGTPWPTALLAAAILTPASAPVLLELVRALRAEGQVTDRLVGLTGIGILVALPAFAIALGLAHAEARHAIESSLLAPAWMVLGSLGAGLLAGLLAVRLNAWIGARDSASRGVLLFAMIALSVGVSTLLSLLPVLTLLAFGLACRNTGHDHAICDARPVDHAGLFFVPFFVAAGAAMVPAGVIAALPLTLALFAVRLLLPVAICALAARGNGLSLRRGALLGAGLVPLSGAALSLLALAAERIPTLGATLAAIVLPLICLTELAGPILTRMALRRSGECEETHHA